MTTVIIGGGLSGLALAHMLEKQGHDYLLLEARNRFGGRIKTATHADAAFDLGPAWFWPGQPRMAALIDQLGLQKFDQNAAGDLMFEDETATVQRGRGMSSMEGSWRLAGGFSALIDALATQIPQSRRRLNAPATKLTKTAQSITATNVVLALPPRIAATLTFEPALPAQTLQTISDIPTWMAGQAKALAIYHTPFWRDAGQSGDAMSRHGPLVEIHDASPAQNGPSALFGFIGVPPQARTDTAALKLATIAQLTRVFGPKAADPIDVFIKDWAQDPHTATPLDAQPLCTPNLLPATRHGRPVGRQTAVRRNRSRPAIWWSPRGSDEAAETAARALNQP